MRRCLFCYQKLTGEGDFHEKCAKRFFGNNIVPEMPYAINEMHQLAQQVVERSISITGVQPKLSMSVLEEAKDKRLTVVGALGGNYIFKPPNIDYPEMPENEHLTMRLAEVFGISTVPSTLIRLKSGELSYLTKRIDRGVAGNKIHMLDMFQITGAFDKYRSSYERIAKAIKAYVENTQFDLLRFYEIVLFSYLVGNNDMHLKNFSLINENGKWYLSPSYDLLNVVLLIPDDKEELALTLNGKKSKITKSDFLSFGEKLGLTEKQIQVVFKRFERKLEEVFEMISISFLSDDMKTKYIELIRNRFAKMTI